jgi:hypothetical protein
MLIEPSIECFFFLCTSEQCIVVYNPNIPIKIKKDLNVWKKSQ